MRVVVRASVRSGGWGGGQGTAPPTARSGEPLTWESSSTNAGQIGASPSVSIDKASRPLSASTGTTPAHTFSCSLITPRDSSESSISSGGGSRESSDVSWVDGAHKCDDAKETKLDAADTFASIEGGCGRGGGAGCGVGGCGGGECGDAKAEGACAAEDCGCGGNGICGCGGRGEPPRTKESAAAAALLNVFR
eukprot:6186819-Pleurochrysis_carterae.AAC.2